MNIARQARILVVDDSASIHAIFRRLYAETDVDVVTASDAASGLAAVAECQPDLVVLDVLLPDASGLEVFRDIQRRDPKLPALFITASGTSETAIEAMKLGAFDYLTKPLDLPLVRHLVSRALELRRLMHVPVQMAEVDARAPAPGDRLVGRCSAIQEVYKAIGRVATQDVTVLIQGETGTGKELVARAIYQHGRRANGPFLAVNCAAIPEQLLESELFGHEKGAFTSADRRRIGKFEQCNHGTLFLDEIGDMTPMTQSKLLRVLQEQRFERVGGEETLQTDVRIIAATNRDLKAMVGEQTFRGDLYYRLNVFNIFLPPLRERQGDIPLLVDYYLRRFSAEFGKDLQGLAPDALAALENYHWPGNIRELQSVVKQTLLKATGPLLVRDFLPETVRNPVPPRPEVPSLNGQPAEPRPEGWEQFVDQRLADGTEALYSEWLDRVERPFLVKVLRACEGNQVRAAKTLGITRTTLRNKLRNLGIVIDRDIE